jgi:ABC-type transport system involved in multi-copper enzyme maturation permease subunit
MYKAIILKELRETRGILLLALMAFVGVTTRQIGSDNLLWSRGEYPFVPFVDYDFVVCFLWISAILAIALGLRQTLGESIHGTYPFLFHRPVNRRWLLGMKLAVGASAYLFCSVIPILIFAWWAATPGTHASPFQWSMTLPVWHMWAWMLLLYLGAFLSGIRPGRWLGTRLLPLVCAGLVTLGFIVTNNNDWLGNVVVFIFDGMMLLGIFFVARQRDY